MITITTATELQNINNDLAGDYELGNDIDLSYINWSPIGLSDEGYDTPFTGTLNGNGHTIKGLKININTPSNEYCFAGLFSTLGGTVQNLVIKDAQITVNGCNICVGILAGAVYAHTTNITNVSVEGEITGTHNYNYSDYSFRGVGGFIGSCYGSSTWTTFTNCISVAKIKITGNNRKGLFVGGFCGYLEQAELNQCYAFGSIEVLGSSTKYLKVAGFVARMYGSSTSVNCATAVSVTGASSSNTSACIKWLCERSSNVTNTYQSIWNGVTFNYESFVSDEDKPFDEDDMKLIIGNDNLSYFNTSDLKFSNNKFLKLAIDNASEEVSYNITIKGVTYVGVKKVIYNGNVISKLITKNGECLF